MQDAWVAVKACEGLMLCASLPEPTAAACLVEQTEFCPFLASRLATLYEAVPTDVSPALVDSVEAKWGLVDLGSCFNRPDNQLYQYSWVLSYVSHQHFKGVHILVTW